MKILIIYRKRNHNEWPANLSLFVSVTYVIRISVVFYRNISFLSLDFSLDEYFLVFSSFFFVTIPGIFQSDKINILDIRIRNNYLIHDFSLNSRYLIWLNIVFGW